MPETHTTFCRICEACCGLEVDVDQGHVVDIRPDPSHVVSRGYACIKGIKYAEMHESPDRLRTPLERVGDRFEPVTWERALSEIGRRLRRLRREHSPDAVGFYFGNPVAFSTTHPLFMNAFVQGLGTTNLFSAGSQDCNNKFAVAHRMYGSPAIQPVPDVDRTDCLVFLGSNPAVSHSSIMSFPRPVERLRALERRGGRVWFVDPRRNESARLVGEHVFIRPDTDVFLLFAFLHEVLERDALDHARIERHMRGLDRLREVARPWTPERAETVTGVAAPVLRGMVDAYLHATREGRGAALYCSTGVNQGRHGSLAYWALNAINAITGNLDREGGSVVPRGLLDVPRMMKRAGVGETERHSRIGGHPAVLDTLPAAVLPDEITTPGAGQIRALFVTAGNPALSCPDEGRMRQALSELELLVSIDMFRNETGNLAHFILPAASFLERSDLPLAANGFAVTPYIQLTEPVVAPDGEQREEWWIFAQLMRACGVRPFGSRIADVLIRAGMSAARLPALGRHVGLDGRSLLRSIVGASRRVRWRDLLASPHGVLLEPNRSDEFLGKRVLTDHGKVELAPDDLVREGPAILERAFEENSGADRPLKLISKREKHTHNSWMHNAPSLVSGSRHTNYLYMHPDDAADRGLAEGDMARIRTGPASVDAPVRLSDDLMPGAVALPHGWGHAEADGLRVARGAAGTNVNRLARSGPGTVERFAGMTHLTGIPTTVEKARS
ncbi:MAG: molybdopterin-containing oxidoreductase family protein [Myxococcota bacterium]